eukprot:NODE_222_length_13951_cov_0.396982.p5 type:complete len:339 gc:universal NODE_222_length_13951_cov_0.396982:10640-9624(-)
MFLFQFWKSNPLVKHSMTLATVAKIGTHSGTFHADEVLACSLLRLVLGNVTITRSRDSKLLDNCDYVVDVGGVYDHSSRKYDHHQREFNEVFGDGYFTKLSSAGLIYKHYGKDVIKKILNTNEENTEVLHKKIYSSFIEAFDGIDNGVDRYPKGVNPKYKDNTTISAIIASMNGTYVEPEELQDERFENALKWMTTIFERQLENWGKSWLPSRKSVLDAILSMNNGIVILESYLPWKSHLFELEQDLLKSKKIKQEALFVVYPTETSWRATCVPVNESSFENRLSLPEKWRGLMDDELDLASGVLGGTFVHASGFTGGNKTQAGLLKMLQLTIANKHK